MKLPFRAAWIALALAVAAIFSACGGGGGSGGGSPSTVAWTGTKQLGVAGKQTVATGVGVDPHGDVYVVGRTNGMLGVLGVSRGLTGTTDSFVAAFDALGSNLYIDQFGARYCDTGATAVAGNMYFGGMIMVGNTTGGLIPPAATGTEDLFEAWYASHRTGVVNQAGLMKQLGVSGQRTIANGLAIGTNLEQFVVGYTTGNLDGQTLTGTQDMFVTRYDSNTIINYTKLLGVSNQKTAANSVAVDAANNVFVTGYTTGGLDGNSLTGLTDFFITKYNALATTRSTTQLGVANKNAVATGIGVDASGNVFVAGYTTGKLGVSPQVGTTDFFLAKYDNALALQWVRQLGASAKDTLAAGMAVDSSGNVYVAGSTTGGLDTNTLTGTQDFFLTKFDNSGTKKWTRQRGVALQQTGATGVAVDASGNAYVVGSTTGGLDGNTLAGVQDAFVVKYDPSGNKQ